jgi:acyl-coenzyme A thioesterase 13
MDGTGRLQATTAPPDGFVPYQRSSPYLDLIGPLYESEQDPLVVCLWLDHKHANTRGFVHAGLLVALADTILGHTILRGSPASPPIVTASLTTDFIGSAQPGTWLRGQAEVKRHGARVSFANAAFHVDDRLVMTASGVFVSQPGKQR